MFDMLHFVSRISDINQNFDNKSISMLLYVLKPKIESDCLQILNKNKYIPALKYGDIRPIYVEINNGQFYLYNVLISGLNHFTPRLLREKIVRRTKNESYFAYYNHKLKTDISVILTFVQIWRYIVYME